MTTQRQHLRTPRRIFANLLPKRKTYYAFILAAGMTLRVEITAPDARRARLEAEDMADGGELLDLLPA